MADVLQFSKPEEISPRTLRELQEFSLLDRLSQETVQSLGLQRYAERAFPLHSFSQEPEYFVGSIVAQILVDDPAQAPLFSTEIPLERLVLQNIGGVRLEEANERERLDYLRENGVIAMLPNQNVSISTIDFVLRDFIAMTFGNPPAYESEHPAADIMPIEAYRKPEGEEETGNSDDAFIIQRKVTLRTRDFGTPSRSLERALKKLKQDIPDKSLYKRKKPATNHHIGATSSPNTLKHKSYGVNLVREFEHELAEMTPEELEEFEKELDEGGKTSKQILAEAPKQLTYTQTLEVMTALKYSIDPGFPNYGMQKLLKRYGGLRTMGGSAGTLKKKDFIEAYRQVLETFYPITGQEVASYLMYRAAKSRFDMHGRNIGKMLSELYIGCRPIEFNGVEYFDPRRVQEVCEIPLPDLDEMRILPAALALNLVREYEESYGVRRMPYVSRELVDRLPKYTLVPEQDITDRLGAVTGKKPAYLQPKKSGELITREDLEAGVIAMLKHGYHVEEMQCADTETPIGRFYRERDEQYRPKERTGRRPEIVSETDKTYGSIEDIDFLGDDEKEEEQSPGGFAPLHSVSEALDSTFDREIVPDKELVAPKEVLFELEK
ncbi:MAG: hypothetical protein Q7R76_02805 [Candidatus Woesearchaeota archaeon]|nr:hypothetical protein [Candidatus Woesearchaeota archaeon]